MTKSNDATYLVMSGCSASCTTYYYPNIICRMTATTLLEQILHLKNMLL